MGIVIGGMFPCPRGGGNATVFKAVQRGKEGWELHYRCDWCKREFVAMRPQHQKSVRLKPHARKVRETA